MSVRGIDHLNIAGPPELIARCRAFYIDILGMADGHRPPFRSRGYWLYANDHPVVHLREADDEVTEQRGPLDHIALACDGFDEMLERLKSRAIPFTLDDVPATNQAQIFLHDPAGIGLELNFRR